MRSSTPKPSIFGHIDIQQQQVDIHILLEHEDGLRTVLCLRVVIFLAEDCLEHFSVEFRVVNNQNFLSVHSRSTAAGRPPSLCLPEFDRLYHFIILPMQCRIKENFRQR